MNTQIVAAGLRARPVRTAVGVFAVTLEVVLILLLVGVTNGAVEETGKRVAGVGAEVVVKDSDSSYFMGINSTVLPIKELTDRIMSIEGVKAVAPAVAKTDSGLTVVSGIERESFNAVSGGFTFIKGDWFSGPDEAMVDNWQASKKNLKVGDTTTILKRPFKVTGIVQNGKMSRIFIPIETLQEKEHAEGFATVLYVKLKPGVVIADGVKRLKEELAKDKFEAIDANEWASQMFESNASLINGAFRVVVFLGVTIGVLVIFLSTYTSVTERTREIGILRSMGGSKGFIVALVLQESLMLCVVGIVFGIGASYAVAFLLPKLMPTTVVIIPAVWVAQAALFALLSGVIGSLYPAYKAASQDPIEALAYE